MGSEIATVILHELMENADYAKRVLPHLESEYFRGGHEYILSAINTHFSRYEKCPTRHQVGISISNTKGIPQEKYDDAVARLKEIGTIQSSADTKWLMDRTQEFIEEQRCHNFVVDLIHNLDENKPLPSPEKYAQAITFSFSEAIGHDLFRDWQALHHHMTDTSERFPFDLPELNRLTNGGVTRKTLNILLAPTNAGKSLVLCHLAAAYVRQGRSVLYTTLEMSQFTTAQRITANLLDIGMGRLQELPSDQLGNRMATLRDRYTGNLVIREFPASSGNVSHFRALMQDLKRTQNFVPDVVIVDYLNLCGAASLGKSARGDLYQTVGTIAAELRGLATEQNVVVWTATQTNRSGYKEAELELEHMSESYSVNSTADLIFGLSRDEKLPDRMTVKWLKHRNEGIPGSRKAIFTVDSARMKIIESDPAEQVQQAISAMPPKRRHAAATRVDSRKPTFAIDDENDDDTDETQQRGLQTCQ